LGKAGIRGREEEWSIEGIQTSKIKEQKSNIRRGKEEKNSRKITEKWIFWGKFWKLGWLVCTRFDKLTTGWV
jgi:hypothetical protein